MDGLKRAAVFSVRIMGTEKAQKEFIDKTVVNSIAEKLKSECVKLFSDNNLEVTHSDVYEGSIEVFLSIISKIAQIISGLGAIAKLIKLVVEKCMKEATIEYTSVEVTEEMVEVEEFNGVFNGEFRLQGFRDIRTRRSRTERRITEKTMWITSLIAAVLALASVLIGFLT